MIKMLPPHELKKLRSGFLDAASKNMAQFVKENRAVLFQLNDATLEKLNARDIPGITASSYQLFSAARSFGRQDIENIATLLYKTMKKPKFAREEEVLILFEKALRSLGGRENSTPELEVEFSKQLYQAFRKISANS